MLNKEIGLEQHFKVLFYTKTREYEIYYNNSSVPLVRASYDNNYYFTSSQVTDLKPQGFFAEISMNGDIDTADAYKDYLSIDNVKISKVTNTVYYGSAKIVKVNDDETEEDITATGLAAGNVAAKVDVRNLTDAAVPVTLIAALYNGDSLADISVVPQSCLNTAEEKTTTISTKVFTVPSTDTDQYKLKVFVWDGTTTLQPLTKPAVFTAAK